jgi:hypothetical protein
MSRLIDADKLIEILSKNSIFRTVTNAEGKSIIEIIEEQPTAFDVDKIYNKAIDDFADKIAAYGTYDDYGNVIDILEIAEKLKAGGRDED